MLLALLLAQWQYIGPLVRPPVNGQGLWVSGWRGPGDTAADVIVTGQQFREGSYIFGVWQPGPCWFQAWAVAMNGDMHFGQALTPWCTSDPGGGTLVDISGVSGHAALRMETGYLTTQGSLGKEHGWKQANGELPTCGVTPFALEEPDGGCYLPYAGEHGDHTWGSRFAMRAGFLGQLYNPLHGDRRDYVAEWNHLGAYSQGHGLTLAQFPTPRAEDTYVMAPGGGIGTFIYGTQPGAQMWDGPKGGPVTAENQRWYYAKPLVDGGAEWEQYANGDDIDELKSQINMLLSMMLEMNGRISDAGIP